jgi:lipid-A-disaccharide synthase
LAATPLLAVVAGEVSGDLLAAPAIRAILRREPGLHVVGVAGERMIEAGCEPWHHVRELSVRGYTEVLRELPRLLWLRRSLRRRIVESGCRVLIGVDSPDFNLALETSVRAAGVSTVHYVSPSIWAWRPERIHAIGRCVDRMLVLFPFEEAIYRKAGIAVNFVGHPLADAMPLEPDRREARAQLRLGPAAGAVALLPGSRVSELELHADLVIETARELAAARPELRFFVPLATRETRDYFEGRLYALEARELPITILFGHAQLALCAADVALVASGTATLEAALARCPMVITYRLNPITYWLVKRRALLPYAGLPNILAGEFIVPELLQDEATPGNLAQALGNWLDNKTARERLRVRFASLHESLAKGHDERVCEALAPYLSRNADHDLSAPAPDRRLAMRGR